MLEKAKPVSQIVQPITALFYGASGTGKTTLSCTFPKPLVLLDFGEHGTDSIRNVEGVTHLFMTDWDEVKEVHLDLKKDSKYKTVVIDAVHGMQNLAILEALSQSSKDEESQKSKRDFGVASGLLSSILVNFRDLNRAKYPKNVIFLAHDRVFNSGDDEADDGTLQPIVGPRVMPSVSSTLTGSVNIVGNTYIREFKTKKTGSNKSTTHSEYCLRLGPHGYYITKIRKPRNVTLPSFLSDPSYDRLLEVMGNGRATPATNVRKVRR